MTDRELAVREAFIDQTLEGWSPAKLNLTLRIVGRRDDGYHLLQMRNVLLGFGDSVTIRFRADPNHRSIVGSADGVVGALPAYFCDVARNLASRAAVRFLEALGLPLGFEIAIVKRIPSGAGLGGGSSNAATVLRLLAEALRPWGELSSAELGAIALGLGADVPFFLEGRSAFVEGIGEVVSPCSDSGLVGVECVVVLPSAAVPTPRAYELFRTAHPVVATRGGDGGARDHWGMRDQLIGNDLEAVVGRAFPAVQEALERLRGFPGTVVGMTGSGSALFCLPRTGTRFADGVVPRIVATVGCPVIHTAIV